MRFKVPGIFESQLQRATFAGYLPVIQREAARINETTAHILAICSRETNMRNIRGDYHGSQYHGFGLMQIDIATDPHFAATWSEHNFEPGIVRGCDIYAQKCADVAAHAGKQLQVRQRNGQVLTFTGRSVERDDIRRIGTAAYNNGRWPEFAFSRNQHIDSYTTGGDYGKDVYQRAIYFAMLLDQSGLEPGAFKREVEAQGDYALAVYQQQAGVEPTPDAKEMLKPAPLDEGALGNYQMTVPAQGAAVTPDSAANLQSTAPPPGTDKPSPPGDVKLYIQSLRNTVQDWLAYLGIPGAAVYGWGKAHPEVCAAVVIAAVLAFWFYKTHIKHKLDIAAIQTAADPKLNTVRFDKRAT